MLFRYRLLIHDWQLWYINRLIHDWRRLLYTVQPQSKKSKDTMRKGSHTSKSSNWKCERGKVNPQPSTLDSQLLTLDPPQPSTLDSPPSTPDPRPSTFDPRPSTLDYRHVVDACRRLSFITEEREPEVAVAEDVRMVDFSSEPHPRPGDLNPKPGTRRPCPRNPTSRIRIQEPDVTYPNLTLFLTLTLRGFCMRDLLRVWLLCVWLLCTSPFLCGLLCVWTFCVCELLCVWHLCVWPFVYVIFCECGFVYVTFCLCDRLCVIFCVCDLLCVWLCVCDLLFVWPFVCGFCVYWRDFNHIYLSDVKKKT